ncbi:MAG: hypothetical protein RIR48_2409 [Bacteroidota bacterium]
MKNILYLTFYFEPDLCAGSFRNSPLAKELSKQLKGKANIHVITTLPNRYHTYSIETSSEQIEENLFIKRLQLPIHKNGLLDQVFSFWHFYRLTSRIVKDKKYDLVFASSSRLFTAFLGHKIAKKQAIPLILDIRDIFTDTLPELINNRLFKYFMMPFIKLVEQQTFNSAKHINLISQGFTDYFSKYKAPIYSHFTHGIDEEFICTDLYTEHLVSHKTIITYAGNIGEGQGLHKIIPQAASILGDNYLFRVIGDGGAKQKLIDEIDSLKITNVIIEPPVRRKELLSLYKQSHFLFLHLNDFQAFKKVLPSKIFELAAFPRPIIAGVNGFAHQFIRDNIENVILFAPADLNDFLRQLKSYEYKLIQRTTFIKNYNRAEINRHMSKMISSYL